MKKILIACEESQTVCKAFRERGFEAYSNDILECSGGHPKWHLQMDVFDAIKLMDWDAMIAFPPCTHLAVSGAAHFAKKIADGRQQQGIDFFMKIANININYLAIENPVGIMSNKWRKPDQIIQPYMFGDSFSKKTCLWLKGFPLLIATDIVDRGEFVTFASGKKMPKWYAEKWGKGGQRSITFQGIANAMAIQWGDFLNETM
jgi:site-specific DNA-cytosine methylase